MKDFCITAFWLVVIFITLLSNGVSHELCVLPSDSSQCPCNNTSFCHTFDYYMSNSGEFTFSNVVISLYYTDTYSCARFMMSMLNVNGLISISDTRYHYVGLQLALLAIDIGYSSKFIANTTVIIADTEVYQAGVALAFIPTDVDATESDSSCLEIVVENVLISGSDYIGLGLEIGSFWGTCNVTILNSTIENVNGTALSLGLDNFFPSNVVIKKLTTEMELWTKRLWHCNMH